LYKNSTIGFGSIIADDMGLGKTLQVITTLLKFKEEGLLAKKKALVWCPTTLADQLAERNSRFAPALLIIFTTGPAVKCLRLSGCIAHYLWSDQERCEKLSKFKWYVAVIDEAQNIKNPGTAQTKAIKKLKSDVQMP
jgi:SNF2 family DNA or RNA helicase